ncbi:MAG: hypothetical protein WCO52_04785 [bacterium]
MAFGDGAKVVVAELSDGELVVGIGSSKYVHTEILSYALEFAAAHGKKGLKVKRKGGGTVNMKGVISGFSSSLGKSVPEDLREEAGKVAKSLIDQVGEKVSEEVREFFKARPWYGVNL